MRRFPRTGEHWEDWAGDITSYLEQVERFLAKFIGAGRRGCHVSYVSGTEVSVGPGEVWTEQQLLVNGESVTIATASDLAPDTSTLPVDGPVYIYAMQSTTDPEQFAPVFSTTAPTVKGAGRHPTKEWAYLGAVWRSSSSILPFTKVGRDTWQQSSLADNVLVSYGTAVGTRTASVKAPPGMHAIVDAAVWLQPTGGAVCWTMGVGPVGGILIYFIRATAQDGDSAIFEAGGAARPLVDANSQIDWTGVAINITAWTGGTAHSFLYCWGFTDPFLA